MAPEGLTPPLDGEQEEPPSDGPGAPEFTIDADTARLLQIILGAGTSDGTKKVDPTVTVASRDYFDIWGVDPPHGYIEGLVKSGLNRFEIISHELSKPQARRTAYYRDNLSRFAAMAAQVMGFR